jgi:hypothetical protein
VLPVDRIATFNRPHSQFPVNRAFYIIQCQKLQLILYADNSVWRKELSQLVRNRTRKQFKNTAVAAANTLNGEMFRKNHPEKYLQTWI